MCLCVLDLPKTHINISWRQVRLALVTISNFLPRLIWLAAYRPVRVVIVQPNIHPIMHPVSQFLLKYLSPASKTLIDFPIYPNRPIAVRIKIRRALDSGQSLSMSQLRIWPQNWLQNSRVFISLATYCQFFRRTDNSKPKKQFLRKQQIFAKTAKFIWIYLVNW